MPKTIVATLLLAAIDADAVEQILRTKVLVCYLTKQEDRMIHAAGFKTSTPDIDDPWRRYRESGLDPSTYQLSRQP